jgi:hypothetical protein
LFLQGSWQCFESMNPKLWTKLCRMGTVRKEN